VYFILSFFPPVPIVHPAQALVSSQGVYVPPSKRRQATPSAAGGAPRVMKSRRNKAPPDIQNTAAFPSLRASQVDSTSDSR